MKCSSCGSNYAVKLLECPYCGAQNVVAIERNIVKEKRQLRFKNLRLHTLMEASPVIVTKTLTRLMIASIILFVITFSTIVIIGTYSIWKGDLPANPDISLDQHNANLAALAEDKGYMKIADYLCANNLSGQECPDYWQLYEIYDVLFNYRLEKDHILNLSTDSLKKDTHKIQYALEQGQDVLDFLNENFIDAIYPQNKKLYDECYEEVYTSFIIDFKFSDVEIKEFIDANYTESNGYKKFVNMIKERMSKNE